MGHLVNPIGFRIGRKKSFFWSNNLSFFYNRKTYRKITSLYHYLDLLIRYIQTFIRKVYGRPFIFGRRFYSIMGSGGQRSLLIKLSLFDSYRVLQFTPKKIQRKLYTAPYMDEELSPMLFTSREISNSYHKERMLQLFTAANLSNKIYQLPKKIKKEKKIKMSEKAQKYFKLILYKSIQKYFDYERTTPTAYFNNYITLGTLLYLNSEYRPGRSQSLEQLSRRFKKFYKPLKLYFNLNKNKTRKRKSMSIPNRILKKKQKN